MKSLLESRTFWFAVLQAVGGVLIVALTELDLAGWGVMLKSVLDVLLRMDTTDVVDRIV